MITRSLLAIAGALASIACTAHVDVGDTDAGRPDASTGTDASPPPDSGPADAPLARPDGGFYEAPPWVECPPRRDMWADPLAEAAAERFFSRARSGDECLFSGVCGGYTSGGTIPIPGLTLDVDFAYVGCLSGRLAVTTHRVDCGGELTGAPWSDGEPWAEGECVGESPDCSTFEEPRFRCMRVRESDCCVDLETCSLDGLVRVRSCNGTCADVLAGGRVWSRCPLEGEAVPGERCTIEMTCPSWNTEGSASLVHWCDGEHYRVIHDGSGESNCPASP